MKFFKDLMTRYNEYIDLFSLELKISRDERSLSDSELKRYSQLENLHTEEFSLVNFISVTTLFFERPIFTYKTARAYNKNRNLHF